VDLDFFLRIDAAGLSEILKKLLGLFNIDHERNGRDARCTSFLNSHQVFEDMQLQLFVIAGID
jgi:hypothetical protein